MTTRRAVLLAASAFLPGLPGLAWSADEARADVSRWMPGDAADIRVLPPVLSSGTDAGTARVIAPRTVSSEFLEPGMKRIEPVMTTARTPDFDPVLAGGRPAARRSARAWKTPPTAYVQTSARTGVPAWVLFGVALQESQLMFGRETLPWPWTLNVQGRAERHARYEGARDALAGYLRRGIVNVDCGAMQVNWRANGRARFATPARALDPYLNLTVGAQILAEHYAATGDWPRAVGLYHTGSFTNAERRERAVRYVAGVSRRLSRHGLTLAQALQMPGNAIAGGAHG